MSHSSKISIDVLDYIGSHENGILVSLSLGYDGIYYEAIFFYNEDNMLAITPDIELERVIGGPLENWKYYNELMYDIVKKILPYDQAKNIVNEFNPEKFNIFKNI